MQMEASNYNIPQQEAAMADHQYQQQQQQQQQHIQRQQQQQQQQQQQHQLQQQFQHQQQLQQPIEDCRDYLRTGRCKYGVSCKYRHPPNVQSGGGIKGPIDPSEPLFPLRPNEPPCQYFLKHGTCKFGQACKFNHPPQQSVATLLGGNNTVLMNVSGQDGAVTQHILLNSLGGDVSGQPVQVQFLPQRPDEPDCIYFLRNGRCKYGATCRYHHPIGAHNQQQRVQAETRRQPQHTMQIQQVAQQQMTSQGHPDVNRSSSAGRIRSSSFSEYHRPASVQYVSHQQPSQGYDQQGRPHILVSDGSVSFVTLNNSSSMGNPQYVTLSNAPVSKVPANEPPSSPAITSSTVSTSYETMSNFEFDSTSGTWKRSTSGGSLNASSLEAGRRNISGSSLNAYNSVEPAYGHVTAHNGNHVVLGTSASDGCISSGHRNISAGSMTSANDNAQTYGTASRFYGEGAGPWSNTGQGAQPPNIKENGQSWEDDTPSYEVRRNPQIPTGKTTSRRKQPSGKQSSNGDDEGLSMMTSALLTMLDTPQEAVGEEYTSQSSQSLTSSSNFVSPNATPHFGPLNGPATAKYPDSSYDTDHQRRKYTMNDTREISGHRQQQQYTLSDSEFTHPPTSRHLTNEGFEQRSRWSPTWQNSQNVDRSVEESSQSIMQHSDHPGSPNTQSNVGLFLP